MAAPHDRRTGTIKTILASKGFGFIVVDHSTEEYFFHFSGCTSVKFDALGIGMRVSFVPTDTPKGARAEDIGLI